jgi:arylsulfatase A-like enzyme
MMIYCPGVEPRREAAVVQNVDIMPTLLDAVGTEPVEPVHGTSLLPLLRGDVAAVREFAHSGFFGRFHVVSNARYQYHQWHLNDEPLYWYGLQPSLFVGAGPLGLVENTDLGPRRPVDATQNPIGHYRTRTKDGRPWPNALFDLQEDPEQTTNLLETQPELAATFEAEIRRFCTEINAPESYLGRLFGS